MRVCGSVGAGVCKDARLRDSVVVIRKVGVIDTDGDRFSGSLRAGDIGCYRYDTGTQGDSVSGVSDRGCASFSML